MRIETKFDIGEKVYFFIPDNMYVWGKIYSMDISVKCGIQEIRYYIENRFYKSDAIYLCYPGREHDWRADSIIARSEDLIFKNQKDLIAYRESMNEKMLSNLRELVPGGIKGLLGR